MIAFSSGLILLSIIFLLLAIIITHLIKDETMWQRYNKLRKIQRIFLNISGLCVLMLAFIEAFKLTS